MDESTIWIAIYPCGFTMNGFEIIHQTIKPISAATLTNYFWTDYEIAFLQTIPENDELENIVIKIPCL